MAEYDDCAGEFQCQDCLGDGQESQEETQGRQK